MVRIMGDLSRVRMSGPLLPYVEGFAAWLTERGYASTTVLFHARLLANLSRWMQAEGLAVSELGPAAVDGFLAGRAAVGHLVRLRRGSFQPLLGYLQMAGVVPAAEPPRPSTAEDVLLARYASHLAVERGLAQTTIARNVELVRPFLAGLHREVPEGRIELEGLTPGKVTAFVLALSRWRTGSVPRTVTALRSLLRFLHADGLTATGLADAVPTVARWKLAGLPKALTADQVAALLATCDRGSVVGRRDLAIMTVLSRLGLRAGEVARLRLGDVDWRRGEIAVTGKGCRHERLPLPADVGEVIVSYLTGGRPDIEVREVFLCVRAPHRAMTRGAVTNVVATAARKAGLGTVHAHRLRHSAATAMLGAGASLNEIGQVLRHRHALTTTIYAKVDAEALRTVARTWPASETAA
jgi:integrase/recombinase XerD